MKLQNKGKFISSIFFCFLLLLGGCDQEQEKQNEIQLRQVKSIIVSNGVSGYSRTFSGTLHAAQEAKLSFKVAGSIKGISVKVGDEVKKDQIIAILDSTPYDLQAQQANASLVSAQAELRNTNSNYERVKKLYEGGNISKNELDNARAAWESSSASVQSARKALEIARLNVSYTKLKMEGDCAIASVDAEEGENVSSGAQIVRATCGDELEVKLDIPETVIDSIKKGMSVNVRFSALPNKVFKATVSEVGGSAVDSGSTFPVTVVLDNSRMESLKTGLSADVVFSFSSNGTKENVLVIPSFSLGEDELGRFVFVLEAGAEGRAIVRRQAVTVGEILQDGIEILDGIKPGARVVTAGVSVLRDGLEVKYSDE